MTLANPLPLLLLQIVVIILTARAFGALARRLRQPSVIGEMAAGIALGPSLLGALAPGWFNAVFPASSLDVLHLVSQIGVVLFMFVVGLDFRWHHVRGQARAAVIVSGVSIVFPFLLGAAAAIVLFRSHVPAGISVQAFALFLGISMSVTAFPVLARILIERRMFNTPIGSMALACAAFDDVTAWTLLALVVAFVTTGGALATVATTILLTAAFVGVMILVVRPLARPWLAAAEGVDGFDKERLAGALVLALGSAIATELIGVHALFGAFVAGAAFPATEAVRGDIRDRLEGFSSVLLLPLFFAFTGLRTNIALIGNASSLLMCAGIIALALVGKFGGTAFAARVTGMNWTNAMVLGALMNTRGLMELIVLNVGYDLGVIPDEMFTALVIMALVTTMMTGPVIDLITARTNSPDSGPRRPS